jgi:hypothetical protein
VARRHSDLIGVPDLFARVAPVLESVLPAGRRDPRVTGLRRRARIVVTGWVLCVIPLLAFSIGYLLLRLPGVGGGPAPERKPAISGCLARSGWCRGAPLARVLVPAQVAWNRLRGRAISLVGDGQWP